jgi:hypothetical protein
MLFGLVGLQFVCGDFGWSFEDGAGVEAGLQASVSQVG